MRDNLNKKGQITIFVILAIVIVLSIGIVFYATSKPSASISPREDPKGYMDKCIKDALTEAELAVIPHGGFANSSDTARYEDIDVVWMCYTNAKNKLCANKHPVLKSEIEREITQLIKPKIETCFKDIAIQLAKYDYTEGELNVSTEILLDKVEAKVRKKITFTKNEQTITLSNFDSSISSPLYYFAKLSLDIVNQEVSCDCLNEACNADIITMNRFNRDFEITKQSYTGSGTEIYVIKEILTGKQFNFAIRNCVRWP